jgi:predicted enzyme related to lactoylglutathione lyase
VRESNPLQTRVELSLVEFPANDPERARRFWEGLLGVPFAEREEVASTRITFSRHDLDALLERHHDRPQLVVSPERACGWEY